MMEGMIGSSSLVPRPGDGMNRVYVDFETYYDRDYSLTRLTPWEYVWDQRFSLIGAGVCESDTAPPVWMDRDHLSEWVRGVDWANTELVSHNLAFDACVMLAAFDVVPAKYMCTLSLARAFTLMEAKSASLAATAEHLGIGSKTGPVQRFLGMDLDALRAAPEIYAAMREYAMRDVWLCREIHARLRPRLPQSEEYLIDRVVRMVTEPALVLDRAKLEAHLANEQARKARLLSEAEASAKDLTSSANFMKALVARGVDVQMKPSPRTPGKLIPAFAKTDDFMRLLLDGEYGDQVRALAMARLGVRSTIEETRAARLIAIHDCTAEGYCPVPLRYSGAHTHRLSGDWALNLQNLPRKGELRGALRAPDGHVVVAADAAQIEARIVAWLAGETKLVNGFRRGEDVYSIFASELFSKPVSKTENPHLRHIGKVAILGLGYGMGAERFAAALPTVGHNLAAAVVRFYRNAYIRIYNLWHTGGKMLLAMARGDLNCAIGPCVALPGALTLPNGMQLRYPRLRQDATTMSWFYSSSRGDVRIYGPKVIENITQALARIIVLDVAKRLSYEFPHIGLAMTVHDSLVYVCREDVAPEFSRRLAEEMCVPLDWCEDLPLACSIGIGRTLLEAEENAG
jgi:DNA polymerase